LQPKEKHMLSTIDVGDFYTNAIETLTLSDALRRHYVLNAQFTVWNDYKSEIAQKLVKAHDISHLIFGCDTSLLGEMRVQLWAKFGVQQFGFRESFSYAKDKEARVLLKNPVGYWSIFKFFVTHFGEASAVRAQSKKMAKKWVYFKESDYMEMTVGEIRTRFGVAVIKG
jgi:hypothetical protein